MNNNLRAALAAFIALAFYAGVDVMIWARLFETKLLWHYHIEAAPIYHQGWGLMLVAELVLGLILLWPSRRAALVYCSTLYLFAINGAEDVLYYLLQGKSIPARLEWLDWNPLILFKPVTCNSLLLGVWLWIIVYLLIFLIPQKREQICEIG